MRLVVSSLMVLVLSALIAAAGFGTAAWRAERAVLAVSEFISSAPGSAPGARIMLDA